MVSRITELVEEIEPEMAKALALSMKPIIKKLHNALEAEWEKGPVDFTPIHTVTAIAAANLLNYGQTMDEKIATFGQHQKVFGGILVTQLMLAMIVASASKTLCQFQMIENDEKTIRSLLDSVKRSKSESPPPSSSSGD